MFETRCKEPKTIYSWDTTSQVKPIKLGLMTNTYRIKDNHNVLFNEENKSLSSSEWDVWITFYSLLQIEYGLNDVNIK